MDYKQVYAIQNKNKERIKKVCPEAKDRSGIYILTREENSIKYAYVGQAKKILSRLADHLKGFQHIDASLKKHGFYSFDNKSGWHIICIECEEDMLNNVERLEIINYANMGYQLYNHTTGGQDNGKSGLKETVRKGYQEGLHKGYEKARKEIAHIFDLHLTFDVKKQGNKVQEKAKAKFVEFLKGD